MLGTFTDCNCPGVLRTPLAFWLTNPFRNERIPWRLSADREQSTVIWAEKCIECVRSESAERRSRKNALRPLQLYAIRNAAVQSLPQRDSHLKFTCSSLSDTHIYLPRNACDTRISVPRFVEIAKGSTRRDLLLEIWQIWSMTASASFCAMMAQLFVQISRMVNQIQGGIYLYSECLQCAACCALGPRKIPAVTKEWIKQCLSARYECEQTVCWYLWMLILPCRIGRVPFDARSDRRESSWKQSFYGLGMIFATELLLVKNSRIISKQTISYAAKIQLSDRLCDRKIDENWDWCKLTQSNVNRMHASDAGLLFGNATVSSSLAQLAHAIILLLRYSFRNHCTFLQITIMLSKNSTAAAWSSDIRIFLSALWYCKVSSV